jgi:hypothetical protein
LFRQFASATAFRWDFDFHYFEGSHFTRFSKRFLFASVRGGERQHCRARSSSPHKRRSRRDFKKLAFPMAEERWSVAVAEINSMLFQKSCKPEN